MAERTRQLKWGAHNLANGQAVSGCTILCWHLLQKYGEDGQHTLIRVASELKSFQRQQGESIKDALQRHDMLLQNAYQHGVTHNNILVHSLELLGTFKVSKQILPMLLSHTGGRIPINNPEHNTLRNMLVNWSHLIDGHGPNSVPLTIPNNPRDQAFSHGAFPVMGVEEDDYGDTEEVENFIGLPDSRYSDMSFAGAPPAEPAEHAAVPRNRMCEACMRCPGCYHEEGGFDTDTDDDEIFAEDPEFDNQMTSVWAAIKKEPHVFNQVA